LEHQNKLLKIVLIQLSYRFQNGVKGLEQMVKYSEQFKVSMENAFAAADKFRTLEGLLETGANLRVLGGEFAKMDEFKLSFLARNKPQEFLLELGKLTKGMASFNKETGEFDISDVDFDRLRAVADATNMDFNKLVESARQFNQIDLAKKQILIGDSKDKEMIANLAKFKAGSNIGIIKIGSEFVKLTDLTDKHLSALKIEAQTLEERAAQSQNFNDTLTNLVSQLKTTFIPALTYINDMLTGFNKFLDGFRDEKTKELSAMGKFFGGLAIGAVLISPTILSGLWGWLKSAIKFKMGGGLLGGAGATGSGGNPFGNLRGIGAGQIAAAGKANLLTSLGTATTLLGIGAALYFAAKGASALADSIAKLNSDQTTTLIATMAILGATIGGTLIGGVVLLGAATTATSYGLLAFGAAALMVGAGIGLATLGIGKMAEGLGSLEKVDMLRIGAGIAAIGGAAYLMSSPLAMLGLGAVSLALAGISALDFSNVTPLQNLRFVDKDIENMKQMAALLAQINSIDTSKLDALGKLFSSGTMKVQLDGNPVIRIDNRMEIGGQVFYKKVEKAVPIIMKKGFDPRSIDWDAL